MKHKYLPTESRTSAGALVQQCENCQKRTANPEADTSECQIDRQIKSTINRRQKYERKIPQSNFKEGTGYWFH